MRVVLYVLMRASSCMFGTEVKKSVNGVMKTILSHCKLLIIKIGVLEIVRFVMSRAIFPYTISYRTYPTSRQHSSAFKTLNNLFNFFFH